jgi:hypothetical protein
MFASAASTWSQGHARMRGPAGGFKGSLDGFKESLQAGDRSEYRLRLPDCRAILSSLGVGGSCSV